MEKEAILDYVKSEHRIGYDMGPNPPSRYKFQYMTPFIRYLYRGGFVDRANAIKGGKIITNEEKKSKYDEAIRVWNTEILPVWCIFYRKRRIRNWLIRLGIIALSGYSIYYLMLNMHTNKYDFLEYMFYSFMSFSVFAIVIVMSMRRIERYYFG